LKLPFTIAWRYFRRPTDKLISAVGMVSILGLVIGVMALVISMALMTGYREDLQRKLLGGNAEIFVYSLDGPVDDLPATLASIKSVPAVAEASPVIFQYCLVSSEEHTTGEQVMLKAIDPARRDTSPMLSKIIGRGLTTREGEPSVALGRYLAEKLRVEEGSAITVTVPSREGDTVLPQSAVYIVSNVYSTGFHEFDSRWLFLPFDEGARLLGSGAGANLVEVRLHPGNDLDSVVSTIDTKTGRRFSVTDWRQMNRQLFSLLAVQQLVLFIVIGLIVFVSTFNIVSTLIMTVHEKRKEIGILLAMGADGRLIRRVFIFYGLIVGAAGTAAGVILGVAVCWILTKYELISFGPEIAEVYFVSSIPFVTRLRDLAVISVFALLVTWLATLIPSMRSAKLNPIDSLRPQ
jgi:lipoprotein-releasing system permease protein